MKILEGILISQGKNYSIICSRFNDFITKELLTGALDGLTRHGVKEEEIEIVWVPGCFEISLITKKIAEQKKTDAIICLGALIRGDTSHFDYIAKELSKGIAQVGMATGIPTIFGVITCDTLEQAIERAGTKAGNKGFYAAVTAIEMVNLIEKISS